jgi:hypothetical protein
MSPSVCAECNGGTSVLYKRKSDEAGTAIDEGVATLMMKFYWPRLCRGVVQGSCRSAHLRLRRIELKADLNLNTVIKSIRVKL